MKKEAVNTKEKIPEVTIQTQETKPEETQIKTVELPLLTQPDGKNLLSTSKHFNRTSANFIPRNIPPFLQRSLGKTSYLFRVRSPSPTPKSPVLPTTRRTNGIPDTLLERIKLFSSMFKNERFLGYYKHIPPRISSSIEEITKHIVRYSGPQGELSRFGMIFYYIANQITYDIKGGPGKLNDYDQKPETVIKTGLALSDGFCNLFEHFCKLLKLRYKRIEGYCKYFGFKVGDDSSAKNHSWHAIRVRNEWYLCDVTFGSGGNQEKSEFIHDYFNPYYLMTPPAYLIQSHRPLDDDWQMNPKTVTVKQFSSKSNIHLGEFYQKIYEKDVTLVSHEYPIIHTPDLTSLVILLEIPNTVLLANLYYANIKAKICELKYSYEEKTNTFSLEPTFPNNGEYVISILGRSTTSTDLIYHHVINYRIKVGEAHAITRPHLLKKKTLRIREVLIHTPAEKQRPNTMQAPRIITDYNKIFPGKNNKKICLDNTNAYLFEPRQLVLKVDHETKFKVRVKGVLSVIVLDGKKWTYLKRKDEDIWEGQVVLQSETASICSLKPCNVFTEVFQFKTNKV